MVAFIAYALLTVAGLVLNQIAWKKKTRHSLTSNLQTIVIPSGARDLL